jgi:hypothetical protein
VLYYYNIKMCCIITILKCVVLLQYKMCCIITISNFNIFSLSSTSLIVRNGRESTILANVQWDVTFSINWSKKCVVLLQYQNVLYYYNIKMCCIITILKCVVLLQY